MALKRTADDGLAHERELEELPRDLFLKRKPKALAV